MRFNKIVWIFVGTDLSRPGWSVQMPRGRDKSVPTGVVSRLFHQTASSRSAIEMLQDVTKFM